jgi:hypothetical protein
METWRHENMEKWRHGDIEAWRKEHGILAFYEDKKTNEQHKTEA